MARDSSNNINESRTRGLHKGLHQGVNLPGVSPEAMRVLRLLATDDYTRSKMAKHLKISRKTLYKHINNLHAEELYDKQRKGVTSKGYTYLGYGKDHKKRYRGHGYEIYYLLPPFVDKSKWKQYRGAVLSKSGLEWKEKLLKSRGKKITDKSVQFYYHGVQCCCYANGVYVWFPSEVADSPSEAAHKQIRRVVEFGRYLSDLFKIDFIKDNRLNVQIRKSEIAHLDDAVARELREDEKKLYVTVDGELRVICDFSNAIDEFETMSVSHGVTDHHAIETVKEDVAKHGDLSAFTKDIIKAGAQEGYVKDIITHKPEEMPGFESGIFLPSEVVSMFAEQAKHNATLSSNLTRLGELMAQQSANLVNYGEKIDRYGQEIDKHLQMVESVTQLATSMSVQSKASVEFINQLSRVVGQMSGRRIRQKKPQQRMIGDYIQ